MREPTDEEMRRQREGFARSCAEKGVRQANPTQELRQEHSTQELRACPACGGDHDRAAHYDVREAVRVQREHMRLAQQYLFSGDRDLAVVHLLEARVLGGVVARLVEA